MQIFIRLQLLILLGMGLLGCKSNKNHSPSPVSTSPTTTITEDEKEKPSPNDPLAEITQGLRKFSPLELDGRTITLGSNEILAYNDQGKLLNVDEMIAEVQDDRRTYDIYGTEDSTPKLAIFRDKTPADDEPLFRPGDKETSMPGLPMPTQLEYAPHFKHPDMDGVVLDLEALKGKVVVLNFWFTRCQPCIDEMPDLNHLVEQYATNPDVVFLGITFESKEKVARFLDTHTFLYRILPDAQLIAEDYLVMGYPTNLVLDKAGDIQWQGAGYRSQLSKMLSQQIDLALEGK